MVVVCAAVLAGCAPQSRQDEAMAAAARFLDAVSHSDTRTACALLTPRTRQDVVTSENQPCGQALPTDRLNGTAQSGDTWSDQAMVTTESGALFLTEFDNGWLVSAAGCEPDGDAPYRCVVGA
jgi:hypothetical protein